MSDFYNTSEVTCRIPFKCCECRKPVTKGQQYIKHSGVYLGEFFNERMCVECNNIRDAVYEYNRKGGMFEDEAVVPFGNLKVEVRELASETQEFKQYENHFE